MDLTTKMHVLLVKRACSSLHDLEDFQLQPKHCSNSQILPNIWVLKKRTNTSESLHNMSTSSTKTHLTLYSTSSIFRTSNTIASTNIAKKRSCPNCTGKHHHCLQNPFSLFSYSSQLIRIQTVHCLIKRLLNLLLIGPLIYFLILLIAHHFMPCNPPMSSSPPTSCSRHSVSRS